MKVQSFLRPDIAPSEAQQLRAQLGIQATVIDALLRRVTACEARLADFQAAQGAAPAVVGEAPAERQTMARIAMMVQQETGVSVVDLCGPSRTQRRVMARALFCAAARRAKFSSTQIGDWLGGRDHSTVLAASAKEAAAIAYFAASRPGEVAA